MKKMTDSGLFYMLDIAESSSHAWLAALDSVKLCEKEDDRVASPHSRCPATTSRILIAMWHLQGFTPNAPTHNYTYFQLHAQLQLFYPKKSIFI